MKDVCKKVYGLWDDLEGMTADLNESRAALYKARLAGQLPDPRHDEAIISRASFTGSMLRLKHLAEYRMRGV